MKALLAIYMIFTSMLVSAGEAPVASIVKGSILEVKYVESYTYLRLKTKDGEIWAAVPKASAIQGEEVTIENVMIMNNFESKTLKKTFKTILFGTLGGTAANSSASVNEMAKAHSNLTKTLDAGDTHVQKASGSNSKTVAEIMMKGAELKDQTILVRGKVVKFNPEIMGKNWVHLRDGTGSITDNTNDVLVTTMNKVKVGDIVTAKGVVRTNQDYGAGYSYKVLIEDASLQP
jgi:hypothetical protein